MNTAALTQIEIISELSLVPEDKLSEVKNYIHSLVAVSPRERKKGTLSGIWKDTGFAGMDVQKAIDEMRKEIGDDTIRKHDLS